jgi:NADH dehydrogenase/NADH:ubiquinone oxidoreductase subunit G
MEYGYKESRFEEYKRAVFDKNIGPIITTSMNRCIHCTRCIRFAEEVAGVYDLGTMGRGNHTEIGTYIDKMVSSELSGNLVDLCPVGALVSGPHKYVSRSWETRKNNSIDLMESILPKVEYNRRGPELIRCLPKIDYEVNEEWISDKSRYIYDGLKR